MASIENKTENPEKNLSLALFTELKNLLSSNLDKEETRNLLTQIQEVLSSFNLIKEESDDVRASIKKILSKPGRKNHTQLTSAILAEVSRKGSAENFTPEVFTGLEVHSGRKRMKAIEHLIETGVFTTTTVTSFNGAYQVIGNLVPGSSSEAEFIRIAGGTILSLIASSIIQFAVKKPIEERALADQTGAITATMHIIRDKFMHWKTLLAAAPTLALIAVAISGDSGTNLLGWFSHFGNDVYKERKIDEANFEAIKAVKRIKGELLNVATQAETVAKNHARNLVRQEAVAPKSGVLPGAGANCHAMAHLFLDPSKEDLSSKENDPLKLGDNFSNGKTVPNSLKKNPAAWFNGKGTTQQAIFNETTDSGLIDGVPFHQEMKEVVSGAGPEIEQKLQKFLLKVGQLSTNQSITDLRDAINQLMQGDLVELITEIKTDLTSEFGDKAMQYNLTLQAMLQVAINSGNDAYKNGKADLIPEFKVPDFNIPIPKIEVKEVTFEDPNYLRSLAYETESMLKRVGITIGAFLIFFFSYLNLFAVTSVLKFSHERYQSDKRSIRRNQEKVDDEMEQLLDRLQEYLNTDLSLQVFNNVPLRRDQIKKLLDKHITKITKTQWLKRPLQDQVFDSAPAKEFNDRLRALHAFFNSPERIGEFLNELIAGMKMMKDGEIANPEMAKRCSSRYLLREIEPSIVAQKLSALNGEAKSVPALERERKMLKDLAVQVDLKATREEDAAQCLDMQEEIRAKDKVLLARIKLLEATQKVRRISIDSPAPQSFEEANEAVMLMTGFKGNLNTIQKIHNLDLAKQEHPVQAQLLEHAIIKKSVQIDSAAEAVSSYLNNLSVTLREKVIQETEVIQNFLTDSQKKVEPLKQSFALEEDLMQLIEQVEGKINLIQGRLGEVGELFEFDVTQEKIGIEQVNQQIREITESQKALKEITTEIDKYKTEIAGLLAQIEKLSDTKLDLQNQFTEKRNKLLENQEKLTLAVNSSDISDQMQQLEKFQNQLKEKLGISFMPTVSNGEMPDLKALLFSLNEYEEKVVSLEDFNPAEETLSDFALRLGSYEQRVQDLRQEKANLEILCRQQKNLYQTHMLKLKELLDYGIDQMTKEYLRQIQTPFLPVKNEVSSLQKSPEESLIDIFRYIWRQGFQHYSLDSTPLDPETQNLISRLPLVSNEVLTPVRQYQYSCLNGQMLLCDEINNNISNNLATIPLLNQFISFLVNHHFENQLIRQGIKNSKQIEVKIHYAQDDVPIRKGGLFEQYLRYDAQKITIELPSRVLRQVTPGNTELYRKIVKVINNLTGCCYHYQKERSIIVDLVDKKSKEISPTVEDVIRSQHISGFDQALTTFFDGLGSDDFSSFLKGIRGDNKVTTEQAFTVLDDNVDYVHHTLNNAETALRKIGYPEKLNSQDPASWFQVLYAMGYYLTCRLGNTAAAKRQTKVS